MYNTPAVKIAVEDLHTKRIVLEDKQKQQGSSSKGAYILSRKILYLFKEKIILLVAAGIKFWIDKLCFTAWNFFKLVILC